MKKILKVKQPTPLEYFTLRLMILLGIIAMSFFIKALFFESTKGNPFLYGMLLTAFGFSCLKVLHEWCHYFYITVPETPVATRQYTVDIFTTFCPGEPLEMITETLHAIQAITYPHETYLCDEGDDPYLRELCQSLGVHHVTRTLKVDAKAGNINNALRQSKGELCVILDPDHVPFPGFMDPIVSHFDDPEIGFIQIVQAYKNHEESLIAKGAAQQTYQFYGPMMMTMNKYGTVQAIGANCTFRRTALESIGGHAAGLAEDMHTSMQLHAKGWKSKYVPQVLARGLVPSNLSAYYQQQLKWSRGVFDLLVTAYPKLFTKFSWQQKLHYAVIPLHYAFGLVYFINFLIPVIALFFDISPIRMNLFEFGMEILPLIISIVLIRHYVQRWTMEDDERGFHMVGGLLMIGSWWVFITGLVYTILKKKVPYVPTPKEDALDTNWKLNIPNFIILTLSISAIYFGLKKDWNPYNLTMSAFAFMNCLFMAFVIFASRQQYIRIWQKENAGFSSWINYFERLKSIFWIFRRKVYHLVRQFALLLTGVIVGTLIYFNHNSKETSKYTPINKKNIFLAGTNWSSSNVNTDQFMSDIVNIPTSWGDDKSLTKTFQIIQKVYANDAIPMLTWQLHPDSLASTGALSQDHHQSIFPRISNGDYDRYIRQMALKIKALDQPIYIYFDNLTGVTLKNHSKGDSTATATEFNHAWQHICTIFKQETVYNTIWAWNPVLIPRGQFLFPGKSTVDWLVTTAGNDLSYRSELAHYNIPVLLLNNNLINPAENINLETLNQDIFKGVIFNQNQYDPHTQSALKDIKNQPKILESKFNFKDYHLTFSHTASATISSRPFKKQFTNIQGVNYNKGQDWVKSKHVFTKEELMNDFSEMKKIGINTIKSNGPDIYDRNMFEAARIKNMNIHYSFYIPEDIDFLNNKLRPEKLANKILNTIKSQIENEKIVAWNIGNPVLQKLSDSYFQPELMYQQNAYLKWLNNLLAEIKKTDPSRPISVDVSVENNDLERLNMLSSYVANIDAFGLVLKDNPIDLSELNKINMPFLISYANVSDYQALGGSGVGVFISNWQDEQFSDRLNLDGLKDFNGRNKASIVTLSNLWQKSEKTIKVLEVPDIKILRPTKGTFSGEILNYHALIRSNNQWKLARNVKNNLKFEWKLVQTDGYENPVSLTPVGQGPNLLLTIPENPSLYRLYLYVIQEETIIAVHHSTLNTPLELHDFQALK